MAPGKLKTAHERRQGTPDRQSLDAKPDDLGWHFAALASSCRCSTAERAKRAAAASPIPNYLTKVDEGSVKEVDQAGESSPARLTNGETFRAYRSRPAADRAAGQGDVRFAAKPEEGPSFWLVLLYQSLPFLLILGVGFFIMRQMQKGAGWRRDGLRQVAREAAHRKAGPRDI